MHTHKPTGTDTHTHTCRSQNTIRKFNNNECDILFIVTRDYTMYEIPAKEIKCTSALTLTESYNKYKILL